MPLSSTGISMSVIMYQVSINDGGRGGSNRPFKGWKQPVCVYASC